MVCNSEKNDEKRGRSKYTLAVRPAVTIMIVSCQEFRASIDLGRNCKDMMGYDKAMVTIHVLPFMWYAPWACSECGLLLDVDVFQPFERARSTAPMSNSSLVIHRCSSKGKRHL